MKRSQALQDAIEALTLHADSRHHLRDWRQEIFTCVAAAKAATCLECDGRGEIMHAVSDTALECQACKLSRHMAEVGCK